MIKITLAEQPLIKIENRNGLYHRNIIDRSVGAENFTFHYAKMEEGGFGVSHSHPESEHFLLVISGELELRNDQESHRVPAGTGILIFPGEVHEVVNINQGPTEYFVIYSPPNA
ncbi:MAG: cupin domain-containing protein [Firmicutes bacterium]|nr:cupin domain-containing protein [Bacillota bacterium]